MEIHECSQAILSEEETKAISSRSNSTTKPRRLSDSFTESFRSLSDMFVFILTSKKYTNSEEPVLAWLLLFRRLISTLHLALNSGINLLIDCLETFVSNYGRWITSLFKFHKVPPKQQVETNGLVGKPLFLWWMEPEAIVNNGKVNDRKVDSKSCHSRVESLFSTASGFNNFRGLLNLGLILLVVSNFRVALENILKYGILIEPFSWIKVFLIDPYYWPSASLTVMVNVFILAVYFIEILLHKEIISERIGAVLNYIVLIGSLIFPSFVIIDRHPNPIFSAPALSIYTIAFMKLWSYTCVNQWCRENVATRKLVNLSREERNPSISSMLDLAGGSKRSAAEKMMANGDVNPYYTTYPYNMTLSNLYYFLFAPTLCYEINFPRTLYIRKQFLLKRTLELFFLSQVMLWLVQQWIVPLLKNSLKPLSESDFSSVVERMLKLAIPNHLIWLMFFYVTFHSALNVIAELLRFGDRLFYKDWWNSESVTEFWSSWNIPVHKFARRHIYLPLLQRGMSKVNASIIVFMISAFFHELLVSVPLRMFRLWAFLGMIGQVPYAILVSKFLKGGQLGNMAVWISLIIGQPMAMMFYFHDYYVQIHVNATITNQ